MSESHPLTWGRHYLMCPPDHFGVLYEINPWMHLEVAVDRDRARAQWDHLVATLRTAGAVIDEMTPIDGLPDMVFTANAGTAVDHTFVPARFATAERQGETPHDVAWFHDRGWRIHELPPGVVQEGAGDALPFGPTGALVAGYGVRSQRGAPAALARRLGVTVHPVELVDPRLYHLDLAFCPLDDRRAIIAPDAFTAASRRRLEALVSEPLPLAFDEALTFAANSIVIGSTVVMPSCPMRVGRQLEAWGFDVVVCDVSEFRKAGGAVRCLTLALDLHVHALGGRVAA